MTRTNLGEMIDTYRAAVFTSADGQSEVVLTGPEHSTLSDELLMQEAAAEIVRAGLDIDFDRVSIVDWKAQ